MLKSALDEMVRYHSPTQATVRFVTEDFELYGQTVRRGQTVLLLVGAANRDPQHFTDPDRFDITRAERRPLSFGQGPHMCIGMALAYLESEIAFSKLLQRLPDIQLIDETPQWGPNFVLRGLQQLPISFALQLTAVSQSDDAPPRAGVCPFHAHA